MDSPTFSMNSLTFVLAVVLLCCLYPTLSAVLQRDILPVMSCRKLRVLNAANNNITGFDTTLKVLSNLPYIQVVSLHVSVLLHRVSPSPFLSGFCAKFFLHVGHIV